MPQNQEIRASEIGKMVILVVWKTLHVSKLISRKFFTLSWNDFHCKKEEIWIEAEKKSWNDFNCKKEEICIEAEKNSWNDFSKAQSGNFGNFPPLQKYFVKLIYRITL